MRYVLFIVVSFSFVICHAQTVEDDFEGTGNITSWYGDNCGINTSFSNPFQSGINTSNTVLRYDDTNGQYANVRFDIASNFDFSTSSLFTIKIYIPTNGITGNQPNQVSLKLQDGGLAAPWSTQSEIIKPLVLDQWQEITFDFQNDTYTNLDPGSLPPMQRTDFNRVLLQVNGENNNDLVVAYIDDFYYDSTATNPGPIFDMLVWSDEFNGSGALDPVKWYHQTQIPVGSSWFNGEVQHYTNRVDNSNMSNGNLNIVAKRETFTDQGTTKAFTSARLNSKFAFTYGRVEIYAKLPSGIGTWPALWMLGKNINEGGAYWQTQGFGNTSWPACGEVDIMEHWGTNQNFVQSAMHTPSSFGNTSNHGGQTVSTASSAFHLYTLEWSSQKMVFSVDGVVHYTYNPAIKDANTWPFDSEQYVLFNVAILPSIQSSYTESTMEIDYIRIYQESALSVAEEPNSLNVLLYPNPVKDYLTLKIPSKALGAKVTITSILGQELNHYIQNETSKQLNFSNYKSGLYIVKLSTEKQVYSYKVLKK